MNTQNRRTFLKTSAALAASIPLSKLAFGKTPAQATTAASAYSNIGAAGQLTTHGILLDKADIPRVRANLKNPRFALVRSILFDIDFDAEMHFLKNELRLNNHATDFARAYHHVQKAALAYVLERDPRQLALCRLALRRLLDYKRWDYFLEGGTETIGIQRAAAANIGTCYALDLLGDELTKEERAEAENKIATEGAPACFRTLYGMKYPDRVRGWGFDPEDDFAFRYDLSRWPIILNGTNLKVIPICGLGMAAIQLHGRHPDAAKWMDMARQSARAFSTMYNSDGSYDEGVGYWSYTTMHLAMFADALYRRLGIDDRQLINYPGTIRYAQIMSMPCGGEIARDPKLGTPYNATPRGDYDPQFDLVNFGDSGIGCDISAAPWVRNVADDKFSQYVANHTGMYKEYQAAIWYQPDASQEAPDKAMLDTRFVNDWVVSRTGWDVSDTVLAFRSGGPANHEHADRNSVIFKAYGERLFNDPFKAAYSNTLPRWLLRQTEAHTAVLIDGRGHQYHDGEEGVCASWAFSRITDFRTGEGWMLATSDATEAYALVIPEAERVARTLLFLKPDVLIMLDDVRLKKAMSVQTRYQVFNDDGKGSVSADGSGFAIDRPLAGLRAVAAGSNGLKVRTGKLALSSDEGVFPYAEVESAAADRHVIVSASTVGPAGTTHGALRITRDGDNAWRIEGKHRKQTIKARLVLTASGQVTFTV